MYQVFKTWSHFGKNTFLFICWYIWAKTLKLLDDILGFFVSLKLYISYSF